MTQYAIRIADISEVLKREQAAAKLRTKYEQPKNRVPSHDLVATSREDREGAGILRSLITRMDPVMWDDHVVVVRMAIPAELMMQLELWGSDTEDLEDAYDLEAWLYDNKATLNETEA